MIIEFSVQNFRSIYDKVTLSMMAAKLTGKEATLDNIFYHPNYPNIPLLKSAVIYGANASGKSNVLKALIFFTTFIKDSTGINFGDRLPSAPFGLYYNFSDEPTCFEMDFIAQDNVRYIYGFKINADEIIEEFLSAFTSRKETKLFARKKGEKIQFSSSFKGEKKILEEHLLKNNLLLSKAANNNYEQMQIVYSYLNYHISIFLKDGVVTNSRTKAYEDDNYRKLIIDFLKVADVGIEAIEIEKQFYRNLSLFGEVPSPSVFDGIPLYNIEVIHNSTDGTPNGRVRWNMNQESEGTQKIFELAQPIIDALNNGDVLILDEFNNSLHPHLSKFIIDLFHNKTTNPKNAQLIFTTHDATLLTKENFRRDQVWFTSKNNKGMTELYSLGDFDKKEVRWDIPFDRWYLTGRFGAVPNIQDFKLNLK